MGGRFYAAIFLVSAAVLSLQIIYTRLFSYAIWYHFAYATIGVAMLGFGASGALLAIFPGLLSRDVGRRVAALCVFAGGTTVAGLATIAITPFDPFELPASGRHFFYLSVYYASVLLPFFSAGMCVAMLLTAGARRVGSLYFADLCGAALGAFLAIPLLNGVGAPGSVVCAALCFVGAALTLRPRFPMALVVGGAMLLFLPVADVLAPTPAPSKRLNHILRDSPGTQLELSRWNAIARIDVVSWRDPEKSRGSGVWSVWGFAHDPVPPTPAHHTIAQDADAVTPMYRFRGDFADFDFLENHILHVPYLVRPKPPDVLVIGVGGGIDVLTALRFGAEHVTGVDVNPVTVWALQDHFADWTGGLYRSPQVDLQLGEGRSFVRRSDSTYDVIQINGVDTLSALASGAYVLAESYLYTREAVSDFLGSLRDGGLLSIVIMDPFVPGVPPRHTIRLTGNILAALEDMGVADPAGQLIVVGAPEREVVTRFFRSADPHHRPIMAMTLLVRQGGPFSTEERERVESFCERNGFAIFHLPGKPPHPSLKEIVEGGAARANHVDRFPLDIRTTSDDRPFFFNFYRWRHLLDHLTYSPIRAAATGQVMLVVMLGQALVFATLLILGPLFVFSRAGLQAPDRFGLLAYFSALGLGFILLEVPLIQKFVLFLGYPTHSFSVTLAALLVFTGLGSLLSSRIQSALDRVLPVLVAVVGVVIGIYSIALPPLFDALLGAPLAIRSATTVVLLAPLGLPLGMFFPLGIRSIRDRRFVPWAWGVNGLTSAVGSVLAVILAITYGFAVVMWIALGVYVVGVLALLASRRRSAAFEATRSSEAQPAALPLTDRAADRSSCRAS